MKKVKGYIFSRPFLDERAPQHVQNIVIRYFCEKNSFHYLLSSSEYKIKNSFVILKGLISKINNFDGIVAYSLFQLPEDYNERNKMLNKIIQKKKFICFAVEEIIVSSQKDIKKVNKIWLIKQNSNIKSPL